MTAIVPPAVEVAILFEEIQSSTPLNAPVIENELAAVELVDEILPLVEAPFKRLSCVNLSNLDLGGDQVFMIARSSTNSSACLFNKSFLDKSGYNNGHQELLP